MSECTQSRAARRTKCADGGDGDALARAAGYNRSRRFSFRFDMLPTRGHCSLIIGVPLLRFASCRIARLRGTPFHVPLLPCLCLSTCRSTTPFCSGRRCTAHGPPRPDHCLVDVFLWQLYPDGLQGDFQLISRLRLRLGFMILFKHGAPDVIVQWVQIWRV